LTPITGGAPTDVKRIGKHLGKHLGMRRPSTAAF
jgi:hypothetical protein